MSIEGQLLEIFQGGERKWIPVTGKGLTPNTTDLIPGLRKRWMVLQFNVTLTCSADVGNRYIQLSFYDGTAQRSIIGRNTAALVATKVGRISMVPWLAGAGLTPGDGNVDFEGVFVVSQPIILDEVDCLRVSIITGGSVNDVVQIQAEILEMPI